jgi:hypothetical protein
VCAKPDLRAVQANGLEAKSEQTKRPRQHRRKGERMSHIIKPVVTIALAMVFTACGNSKPAESKFKGVWSGLYSAQQVGSSDFLPAGTVNLNVDSEGKITGTLVEQAIGTIGSGKISEAGVVDVFYTFPGDANIYKLAGNVSLSGDGKEISGNDINITNINNVLLGKVNFKLAKK